jgi:hypothetical protein
MSVRRVRDALVSVALALCATSVSGATLVVGPEAPIRTVAEAARLARDGDVVEISSGVYAGDVAVWLQKRLTIRGVGATAPIMRADGRSSEGKAIWVLRHGVFDIENIAFEGARVPDLNGAGIRFERGSLALRRCRFVDNENGVLTGNDESSELTVEDSEFAHAPRDRGALKHLLYVGRIARFSLTGSYFHGGFEGHLVKSRARESRVAYNLLDDGVGGMAAYELEFPECGTAYVVGNVIGQSATTTNPAVVAYGAEGAHWSANALYLSHNTLISDLEAGTAFLRVWRERLPAVPRILAINNLTIGRGTFAPAAGDRFQGNRALPRAAMRDARALDFRLGKLSPLRGAGVVPPVVDGHPLAPDEEFMLPLGTRPIRRPRAWTPGAYQTPR